jgi:hypothetical protein
MAIAGLGSRSPCAVSCRLCLAVEQAQEMNAPKHCEHMSIRNPSSFLIVLGKGNVKSPRTAETEFQCITCFPGGRL